MSVTDVASVSMRDVHCASMIISASRRTDIPAFHFDWFSRRLRSGYCTVPNPRNPRQIRVVSLRPADVDLIVFWTRNASVLLKSDNAPESLGIPYVVLWTITGYPRALEPRSPDADRMVQLFQRLSARIGAERVVWRYDPIVICRETPTEFHVAGFRRLARALQGSTTRCIISFADYYRKVLRRLAHLPRLGVVLEPEALPGYSALVEGLVAAARENQMELISCAERLDLSPFGVRPGACIDAGHIRRSLGLDVSPRKDPSQRSACRCAVSCDIGAFGTCPYGCIYCYAQP